MPQKTARSGQRIRHLLVDRGLSVQETARKLKVSPRWVYEYASKHSLPTNGRITPKGGVEQKIIRALVSARGNVNLVAAMYSQSPARIRAVRDRARRHSSSSR